jgi:hypothetical protein
MSFASNVQITTLTSSDVAIDGRTRLNGLYYTCGSTASTIDLYNGASATGTPLVSIATPAAAGAHNVIISDGGVLFSEGIYADLGANVESASLVYVGGGKPAGPGPGPAPTTYTEGINYSSNSVEASDSTLRVSQFGWFNPSEFGDVIGKPPGTSFSVLIGTTTYTGTLLSGFTDGAGLWSASISLPGAPPGPASSCSNITI